MSDTEVDEGERQYEIVFLDDPEGKKDNYLRRDGPAKASFANGDSFEGAYLEGKRHGKGVYRHANGGEYSGDYVSGVREGDGSIKFPDGSNYTGKWANNRRDGQGVYQFANGDRYDGGWKRGVKHGKGIYQFANSSQEIQGEWSNGKLTHGRWLQNGGAKFIGKFMNGQPHGHGIFVSASGKINAGVNEIEDVTKTSTFKPFAANTASKGGKERQPPSALTLANRLMSVAVLSADLVEGAYRLKKEIDGAPNFHRIGETNYFITGQPTVEGIRSIVAKLGEYGYEKTVLVSVRSEPTIYMNDASYVGHNPKSVYAAVNLPLLSVAELELLEQSFYHTVKTRVEHSGGLINYHREIYSEIDYNKKGIAVEEEVTDTAKISSFTSVLQSLAEEESLDCRLVRNPFNQSIPSINQINDLVTATKEFEDSNGLVFVDQYGCENATLAAVVAMATKKLVNGFVDEEKPEGEGELDEEKETEEEPKEKEAEEESKESEEQPEAEPQEEADADADAEADAEEKENSEVSEANGEAQTEESSDVNGETKAEESAEPETDGEVAMGASKDPETVPEPEAPAADAPIANTEPEVLASVESAPAAAVELEVAVITIDERRGDYSFIARLLTLLPKGIKAKQTADALIDECSSIINLRECIFYYHQQFSETSNSSESKESLAWLTQAKKGAERYATIIALCAYLAEVKPHQGAGGESEESDESATATTPAKPTFAHWLQSQPEIHSLIKEHSASFQWN